MKATIDGIQVTGTPEEIKRFKELSEGKSPNTPYVSTKNVVPDIRKIAKGLDQYIKKYGSY
jgi:hypothetical protein